MKLPHFFLLLSFVLIFSNLKIYSQVIRGEVLDSETKKPIPFSSVYFNTSFKGTSTDIQGIFELPLSGYEGQAVVVSCVGYESWIIQDVNPGKYYKVMLLASSKLLKEIVVKPDDWSIERKRKVFLREFFGNSANTKKCYIENIDDLILVYMKSTQTLEGYCYKPLIIHNHALGYKITYFLEEFKWTETRMYYGGYSLFENDSCADQMDSSKVEVNRKKVYQNSRLKFFRELYIGGDAGIEFYIKRDNDEVRASYYSLVEYADQNSKYLLPTDDINIYYNNKFSQIQFLDDQKVIFTWNGYFDPRYISWFGALAKKRVADLLPYEYWP